MTNKIMAIIGIAILALAGYSYVDYQATNDVKIQLQHIADRLEHNGNGRLQYSAVDIALISGDIVIEQLSFEPIDTRQANVSIDKVTIHQLTYAEASSIPLSMTINLENIVLSLSDASVLLQDMPPLQQAISRDLFNIEQNNASHTYDAQLTYTLDPALSTLDIYSAYQSENMASSSISLKLSNFPRLGQDALSAALHTEQDAQVLQQQTQQLFASLLQTSLQELTINIVDNGLSNRIFNTVAHDPHTLAHLNRTVGSVTAAEIKQLVLIELDKEITLRHQQNHRTEAKVLTHARDFLSSNTPKLNIHLTAIKEEGISITDLLILIMMGSSPDMINSLVKWDIQTH